jgi:hypothetical protein
MTRSSIKKVPVQEVAILHNCTQAENIKKLNLIISGPNGDIKEGLAYKVCAIEEHLKDIKIVVNKLEGRADINYDTATKAIHAIEEYKTEIAGINKGAETVKRTRREILESISKVVGIIITIAAFVTTAVFAVLNHKQNSKIKNDTTIIKDDMEDVNGLSRGLKYSPFLQMIQDSVKRDSINKLK